MRSCFSFLDRRSRTRRLRGPLPDSVLEEQPCTNQQDPTRSPYSHSGLLGSAPQRPGPDYANSRMPGLEGGVYIALLLVDRF
jgi:hypothetical protein